MTARFGKATGAAKSSQLQNVKAQDLSTTMRRWQAREISNVSGFFFAGDEMRFVMADARVLVYIFEHLESDLWKNSERCDAIPRVPYVARCFPTGWGLILTNFSV